MRNGKTRIITVTSGKGGVGKTSISLNLALQLASSGHQTCLFDADLGLANINILLGLNPEHTLEDVIENQYDLQDILIRDCQGIDIIAGSSGVEKMADLEPEQVDHLIQSLTKLDEYDFLLFDTSAGISNNVISFCLAAGELILIITPEPTALTDAYSMLKVLSLNDFQGKVKVVVNKCKSVPAAKNVYMKFRDTVKKYISLKLILLGIVLEDNKVPEAVIKQEPFISVFPKSNASTCIKHLAGKLVEHKEEGVDPDELESFWMRWLKFMKSPLNLDGDRIRETPTEHQVDQASFPEVTLSHPDDETPESEKKPDATGIEPEAISEERVEASLQTSEASEPANLLSPESGALKIDQDVYGLMENLINQISSVSEELQLIRKAMENGHNNGSADMDSSKVKPIRLDIESYLVQRGIKRS